MWRHEELQTPRVANPNTSHTAKNYFLLVKHGCVADGRLSEPVRQIGYLALDRVWAFRATVTPEGSIYGIGISMCS